MTARARQSGVLPAILIAFALLLQTLGAAYATGLGAKPFLLDLFGNPLCITSGEHGSAGDDPRHGALTDCCTLACTAAAQTGGVSPEAIVARLPLERPISTVFTLTFDDFFPAPLWLPGNPRAPPSAM